jgi:hypothetical protein
MSSATTDVAWNCRFAHDLRQLTPATRRDKVANLIRYTKYTKMATRTHAKTGPGRLERSFTIKVSEDALPVGLLPPSFPPDYVVGAVAPYLDLQCYRARTRWSQPGFPRGPIAIAQPRAFAAGQGWTRS